MTARPEAIPGLDTPAAMDRGAVIQDPPVPAIGVRAIDGGEAWNPISPHRSEGGDGPRTPAMIASPGRGSPTEHGRQAGENSGGRPTSGLRLRLADDIGSPLTSASAPGPTELFPDQPGSRASASGLDEARGGSDMGRTNALLEQILDELRKSRLPSFVASGRSAYPER